MLAAPLLVASMSMAAAHCAELTAPGPQGDLHGTYVDAGENAPVVLIVPGSGPTDRNGDNPLGVRAAPYRLIADVHVPVLILQGETDLQTDPQDARRLAAAQPAAQLVVLEGVNHVLKQAPAERRANLATYADPDLPLAEGVVESLADFIAKNSPR